MADLCLEYNNSEIYIRNGTIQKNPSTLQESNIDGFLFFQNPIKILQLYSASSSFFLRVVRRFLGFSSVS